MDEENDTQIRFTHYRCPNLKERDYAYDKRGEPKEMDLIPYSRKLGWMIDKDTRFEYPAPMPRGGMTVCEVLDADGNLIVEGRAICSLADNFNYRLGREIALGRAVMQLEEGQ
ncbi:MAG: hypothetical protein ACYTFW_00555 [Planctomycetota bacterium]|jgi:hypothetical protein